MIVAANYVPGGRVSYPYLYERKPGELWITTMQGGLRMKINVADLGAGERQTKVTALARVHGVDGEPAGDGGGFGGGSLASYCSHHSVSNFANASL